MSDFDIVSSIDWHDGVLLEVKTTFKESHFNMTLFIDIYKSENIREKMIVEFSDIDDLVFAMDSAELIDNHKSGNISTVSYTHLRAHETVPEESRMPSSA
nr:hypothetical protein [Escherichia coli]